MDTYKVVSVNRCSTHTFSKVPVPQIVLVEGEGVEGDAHRGITVKHQSRVRVDPSRPNLRQVHLIPIELIEELKEKGFGVGPSSMGENITTMGLDLITLPRGTRLHVGAEAIVEVTGLRNPCKQLDDFQNGLMAAVLERSPEGDLIRKTGVMSIVVQGGSVKKNDVIRVELPSQPFEHLKPV